MTTKDDNKSYSATIGCNSSIIAVSGIIGVGKSTLSKDLGIIFKAEVYYEPVETNEYLDSFYKDMKKYSFPMQIYLLNHRFKQHQQMIWSGKNAIQDRSIYEDVIFAKMLREDGLMEELDFQTYRLLFQNMSNFLHRPDIIVYLDVEPEIALQRIYHRSRDCEIGITIEYLRALKKGYEDWLDDISDRIQVIKIDWNEFGSTDDIVKKINEKIQKKKGLTF
jgi:deoxyadenosine kinase